MKDRQMGSFSAEIILLLIVVVASTALIAFFALGK